MAEFLLPLPSRPIYGEIPEGEARAAVNELMAKFLRLSWPELTAALHGVWDIHGPARVNDFQRIVTVTLERARLRRLSGIDQAAWAVVSLHAEWIPVGLRFLGRNSVAYFAWQTTKAKFYEEVIDALDAAGKSEPVLATAGAAMIRTEENDRV